MTEMPENRQSKVARRLELGRFAFDYIPVQEWWSAIPWYPGSRPASDEIAVTEDSIGREAWLEAMRLVSTDSVGDVTHWYLSEMQCVGWVFLADKSLVHRGSDPDFRWLRFRGVQETIRAVISIWEFGKYEAIPAGVTPPVRGLLQSMQELGKSLDEQALEWTGPARTMIQLSWAQMREPSLDDDRSNTKPEA